jgi:glycosyltransferase involved in cell wall biosynthesis
MRILFFANTDWYLFNFRSALAIAARQAGHEVLLVSPPGPYVRNLQNLGFRWIAAPMRRRSLNPLREIALIAWLRSFIIREQVDLVHGFTIKCAVYGALAARFAGERPRVSAIAGLGFVFTSDSGMARLLLPLVRASMRLAFGGELSILILQNSEDVEQLVLSRIARREQTRLVRGSGVDSSKFCPTRGRDSTAPLMVLLAARLLWDKGISEYVQAARALRASGRKISFLLAGTPDPGNPNSVDQADVQRWEEEGVIQWLGHVHDMPSLLSKVDVMALPTSYGEGVPRSLIEAAASGLALVASDTPGCREIVVHETTGLLTPVRDAESLAQAIARLADDSDLRSRLGSAARTLAVQEFDESIVISQTLSIYQELATDIQSEPELQPNSGQL